MAKDSGKGGSHRLGRQQVTGTSKKSTSKGGLFSKGKGTRGKGGDAAGGKGGKGGAAGGLDRMG